MVPIDRALLRIINQRLITHTIKPKYAQNTPKLI